MYSANKKVVVRHPNKIAISKELQPFWSSWQFTC